MTTILSTIGSMLLAAAVFGLVLTFCIFVYKFFVGSTWKAIRASRLAIENIGKSMVPLFRDDAKTGAKKAA
ncbi:MAG: hypothetical protein HUJ54_15475 [Erysipelotrichaceae bacterium]|nr:hypothetical protein [Erysipelotrichaceae bacterium]